MTSLCPTLRALLKLGFEPRSPKFGAPTVGYKFDCLDLTASDCINRHFQRTIMLSGVLSTRSTIAVIESEMPHDLDLPQDAAAWLSYALRSYQQKLSPLPEWMIEGEKNWDVIPFIREARASEERIRAYDKRTRCNLDRDCARMLRAKLQAELPKHPIDISVIFSFDGRVLSVQIDQVLFDTIGSGEAWPKLYQVMMSKQTRLPKRFMSPVVEMSFYNGWFNFGSLRYQGRELRPALIDHKEH